MQEVIEVEFRPTPVPLAATGMAALEAVHLVMHRIHAYITESDIHGSDDDGWGKPAFAIARINREIGWSNVLLTGDYHEDFEAALEDRNIYPNRGNFVAGARPIGGKRPTGTTNFSLDRPALELVLLTYYLLAYYLMHSWSGMEFLDWDAEGKAVALAQTMLADDRDTALDYVAILMFRTKARKHRLRQLDCVLAGVESEMVICRHCFKPIAKNDPYLKQDQEHDLVKQRRLRYGLERYSIHARCHDLMPYHVVEEHLPGEHYFVRTR